MTSALSTLDVSTPWHVPPELNGLVPPSEEYKAVLAIYGAVRQMLVAIGEDPQRNGLVDTPGRVAKAWLTELFVGYYQDPADVFTTFESEGFDQLVVVADVPLISMCEHHCLPFVGKVHVGYIPNGKIVGLSKIPRLINVFARRLQVQERLTSQIAEAMMTYLNPHGVIVVAEAEHMCMTLRGVQVAGTKTTTSAVRGVFLDDTKNSKNEFFQIIHRK